MVVVDKKTVRVKPAIRVVVLIILANLFAPATVRPEPGDLLGFIPSNFVAPVDLTVDESDGTFWLTSLLDDKIFHLSSDLKTELGTIPIPFDSFLFPFALGIALNTRDDTLLVVDGFNRKIHEVTKDGMPTGNVINVPFGETGSEPGSLCYHRDGDDGAGSLYVNESAEGLIYELTMDGDIIRFFPDVDDPDRFLGLGTSVHPTALDLKFENGELVGFYTASAAGGLMEFDIDGNFTGAWLSLDQAGADPQGITRRVFPHPETAEPVDSLIVVTGTEARFSILEAGETAFPRLTRFRSRQTNRLVQLEWSAWKPFDEIEIIDGCDVIAVLPSEATSWEGILEEDGIHRLAVRARDGATTQYVGPTTVVLGAGEINARVEIDGSIPIDAASDGDGTLIVSDARQGLFHLLTLDLNVIRSVPVSELFIENSDVIGSLAFDNATSTVFLYNHTTSVMGRFDYPSFDLVSTFDVQLPRLDLSRRNRPSIAGMAFRPGDRPGLGTLLMVDIREDVIFEVNLAGIVQRVIPHPFKPLADVPEGSPFGPSTSGISLIAGAGRDEVFLSGGSFEEVIQRRFFRFNLETQETVPGSDIPTAAFAGRSFNLAHTVDGDGVPALFAVSTSHDVYRLGPAPPPLVGPAFLACQQLERGNEVEVTFTPRDDYEAIEIFRDCDVLATLDGGTSRFVDRTAPPGIHTYGVRARRGELWSEPVRYSIRVGIGARLSSALTWPVENPGHLARDPLDGTLFVTGKVFNEEDAVLSGELVHEFTVDFEFVRTLDGSIPAERIDSMAFRRVAGEDPLLFFIVNDGAVSSLLSITTAGEIWDQKPLDPPVPNTPFSSSLAALMWNPKADTFFYLERNTGTFVEINTEGRELRTFPHPAKPPNHFFQNIRSRNKLNPFIKEAFH